MSLPRSIRHGSLTAYQDHKCRCLDCQENKRGYERRAAQVRTRLGVPQGVEHGTKYTYTYYRCRCEPCKEARRSYDRERWEIKNRTQEYRERES